MRVRRVSPWGQRGGECVHDTRLTMNPLRRLLTLFMSPSAAWRAIDQEDTPLWRLYLLQLLPLVLLAMGTVMLGQHLYEEPSPFQTPGLWPRMLALLGWVGVVFFVQLTVAALVAQVCAPWFGGRPVRRRAFALIIHAISGLLVAAVLQPLLMPLSPLLIVLGGVWSVHLLLTGMPVMLQMPPRRARVLSGIIVVLYLLCSSLLMPLADRTWARLLLPAAVPDVRVQAGHADPAGASPSGHALDKIQQADRNLDEAAREAGNARASNDSLAAAQAARDAAAALAATVAGGQERVPLTPAELTRWFPREMLGMTMQSLDVEPWGGVSSRAVMAHASYGRPGAFTLELRVIDPASAGALLAESAATGAQGRKEGETAATWERSYHEGARSVSELRWKDADRVEVSYVLANGVRLIALASGGGIEAAALHEAIRALPLDVLERNRMVPVERLNAPAGETVPAASGVQQSAGR